MESRIINSNKEGHLSDQEIATWVDAYLANSLETLPSSISNHAEDCLSCKERIVETTTTVRFIQSEDKKVDFAPSGNFDKVHKINSYKIFRIAAVALIVVGVGTIFLLKQFALNQTPEALFKQNFSTYPNMITDKGPLNRVDSTNQFFLKGLEYYSSEKYDSAILIFKHLYSTDPSNDTIAIYYANALLASNITAKTAIDILIPVSTSASTFSEQASWYLSLAYLKNKQIKEAKKQLNSLITTSGNYNQKAKKILKEL